MFQSYFKLAYRKIIHNKGISAINIFGLTIAVGVCIAVFLYLNNHWTMDNFHENGKRIYMVEYEVNNGGEIETFGSTPMPLATALANDFPQIEHTVRVDMKGSKVYLADDIFQEVIYFADPSYFEMFSFSLASGSPNILQQPDGIILSAGVAEKYFPKENPVGEVLTIVFDNQIKKELTVQGIAAPFPENTGFKFGILAGFPLLQNLEKEKLSDWSTYTSGTFIQVQEGTDITVLTENMKKYVALHNASNELMPIQSFVFDNLRHPNPKAHEVINRPARATQPILFIIFSMIAILMMALSCFNYINISLGFAGKRLKEIGVRKAIGGQKKQLIVQFMAENLLLCFLALSLGLASAQMFFIPLFNSIMAVKISLSLMGNLQLWIFLLGLLIFTAIASGAYPAFYISAFEPVAIFKGSQQIIRKNKITRFFLGLQFVLAFVSVIASVLQLSMGKYFEGLDWGYQPDQTMVVRLENAKQYEQLKNDISQNPYVFQIAGATDHVGESMSRKPIKIGENTKEILSFEVGANYFKTMGLQLRQGRFFDGQRSAEDITATVINHQFAKEQNWNNPLHQTFRKDGQTYRIVGVVEDFKFAGFSKSLPVAFFQGDQTTHNFLTIRYKNGANQLIEDYAKKSWAKLYPDTPFNFFHQNLVFDAFYQRYFKVSTVFGYLALLALIIACLGLFGLASQNYARYLKEASIRKVLGASTQQILLNGNLHFIWMLGIASIIATSICWVGAQAVFKDVEQYVGVVELGITPYIVGNLLVFVTAVIAVGGQSYQLTKITPADALRNE